MPLQQLDLFGSYEEKAVEKKVEENIGPEPKAEEPVVDIPEEETVISLAIEPSFVKDPIDFSFETVITATPEETAKVETNEADNLIFEDDKIKIKVKPKVVVEQPKQPVKIPGKRGRKSYREIDAELDRIDVPDDEMLERKMYYSITEVAKWFNVNASVLRYWENEFDILKPRKNRKGDRLFRPEDIRNLKVIYYLLRNRKFSIEGAKKYLRNNRKQVDNNLQVIESLTKFRSFLMELKANLGA